jgi:cytochrome c-type biogenesis protein CcmE
MNKIYVIALLLIAASIVIFSNATKDVSTYGSFTDERAKTESIKVIGYLAKEKEMIYDAENSPNQFTFFMNDKNGVQRRVILSKPKPFDFERSEELVLTGRMKKDVFYAHEISMKCPSKYKNEEISLKGNS